jgi:N-acetylmuramoyl-L-alanine amidase
MSVVVGALLLAMQLKAAAPRPTEGTLVVRDASRSQRVALMLTSTGPMLRPEQLNPIVGLVLTRTGPARFSVVVGGVTMEMETGIAAVRVAGEVRQLVSAPVERDKQLFVPLQFVSEILPAFGTNLRWDPSGRQLVVFSFIEHRTTTAAADGRASSRNGDGASGKRPQTSRSRRSGRHIVVVDAGHGGPDNGMTGPIGGGPAVVEKSVTLAVAKRLGKELQARGVDVIYTRTTDTLIALSDRGRIANRAEADLFLSIHVNAANLGWKDPPAARGFETYFLAEARTEDARRVERMENESVRFETGADVSRDDPLSYILSDMKQNEHLRESSELADLIQEGLSAMHPGPNRGVKQAGFRVLVTAFMPSVLVEIGFGTNRKEAEFLNSSVKQAAIASAIADAAVQYLRRYERRVGGGTER